MFLVLRAWYNVTYHDSNLCKSMHATRWRWSVLRVILGETCGALQKSLMWVKFQRRSLNKFKPATQSLERRVWRSTSCRKSGSCPADSTHECRRVNWGRLHGANFRGIESRRKSAEKTRDGHTLARVISCTMYLRTKRHLSPGKNIISCVQTLIAFAKINELLKFSCTVRRNAVTIAQCASGTGGPDARNTTGRGRSRLANWENAGAFFNYGARTFPQTCVFTKLISNKN